MSFAKFREAARDNASPAAPEPSPAGGEERQVKSAGVFRESIIAAGTRMTGKLFFEGPAQIDGQVDGEITSKDKLAVGENAVVNATVLGVEVLIKGRVGGDITASRRLVLQRPARVTGNISAPSLSIEEGVVFEGCCKMGAEASGARSSASAA